MCSSHFAVKCEGESMAWRCCSLHHCCSLEWVYHSHVQGAVKALCPTWEENICRSPVNPWKEKAALSHWAESCSLGNGEEMVPYGVVPGDALTIVATAQRVVALGIAELVACWTWTITVVHIYPQSVPC